MGCFLTVTKEDFDQIKQLTGINKAGNEGNKIRIEIGDKSWSKGQKTKLAKNVKERIAQNQHHRHNKPSDKSQQTARNITSNSANSAGLKAISYSSFQGLMRYKLGKASEHVATRILEEEKNLRILEITEGSGPDLKMFNSHGRSVMVEVKSTYSGSKGSFKSKLKPAYGGHKQCSDKWFEGCGVNPAEVDIVLGLDIDLTNSTYSILERVDSSAEDWKPLVENKPLQDKHFGY